MVDGAVHVGLELGCRSPAAGTQISAQRWRLNTKQTPTWAVGDLIGIKAEPGQLPDAGITPRPARASSPTVTTSSSTTFDAHIQFDGSSNIQFWNSRIERPAPLNGQAACLATPCGGPPFHNSKMTAGVNVGHVISNFFADSTGDDAIAFFDDAGGKVQRSSLRNSFSKRCINSNASPNVTVDAFTTSNADNCMIVFQ